MATISLQRQTTAKEAWSESGDHLNLEGPQPIIGMNFRFATQTDHGNYQPILDKFTQKGHCRGHMTS